MEGFNKIEDIMKSTFLIKDEGILKLLCATVIANRLPFDPVWLFLVAPSAGGKTELISALGKVIGIYPLSSLTSHTFISGLKKKGKETSLLHLIKSGIITFKDFTSILNMHQEERKEIMGQLREIYDGSYVKRFGTGENIVWEGKIGMISGVTTVIHIARELYAAMGERFIMYSLVLPDRIEMAQRAMDNVEVIHARREEIKDAFHHFLDEQVGVPTKYPPVNPEIQDEIKQLAEFSTRARSAVDRDWRSNQKEITFVHTPEVPTRFASQLKSLAIAFMLMNEHKVLQDLDRHIIYKIAFDSINSNKRKALQELARYQTVHTPGLAIKVGFPTATVRRWLEDLAALEVIDRKKGKNPQEGDEWTLKKNYLDIIRKFEDIKPVEYELTADQAVQELYPDQEITAEEVTAALDAREQASFGDEMSEEQSHVGD